MECEKSEVHFHTLAADFFLRYLVQRSLRRIQRDLSRQCIQSLPNVTYRINTLVSALRAMSLSNHIGKIVTSRSDASLMYGNVTITGGCGSLGSIVAKRLVIKSVHQIVLLGL